MIPERPLKIPESVLVVIYTVEFEVLLKVIAFPKMQRAQDLLTNAPGPVDEKQLRELHIRLRNTQA